MLLIKNGYVYDPKTEREGYYDILAEDDKILKIIPKGGLTEEEITAHYLEAVRDGGLSGLAVIDAQGLCIAPGLVDIHVHFRDPGFPYKEDIETGAQAAAAGGFTTVVLMANTKPVVDNRETLSYVLEKGGRTGIHVLTCAAVTKGLAGKELTDLEELRKAGAAGFTDDGIPLLSEELLREAMRKAAALDVPISLHEENPALICNNGVNAGKAADYFGIGGSPREAETDLVARDTALALETGAKVNIQHISSGEAVELVRQAKKQGGRVYAEATPHHFTLTQEALIEHGTLAKMNPPLREEKDRLAIIAGLQDGTIDFIATDHAPHSREEKAQEITKAPSGIIGLETALSLGITELVHKGFLSMQELLRKMTVNPAGLYGLDAGCLREGGPADLVIFHAEESREIREFVSRSENSPFLGRKLQGVVHYTICGGQVVYRA